MQTNTCISIDNDQINDRYRCDTSNNYDKQKLNQPNERTKTFCGRCRHMFFDKQGFSLREKLCKQKNKSSERGVLSAIHLRKYN